MVCTLKTWKGISRLQNTVPKIVTLAGHSPAHSSGGHWSIENICFGSEHERCSLTRQRKNMMTSSNGNIFRVTGHLCREFTGEFPAQRPVTRSFHVFYDLRLLHKPLSKQSWGWWFETLTRPSWRHCNLHFIYFKIFLLFECFKYSDDFASVLFSRLEDTAIYLIPGPFTNLVLMISGHE